MKWKYRIVKRAEDLFETQMKPMGILAFFKFAGLRWIKLHTWETLQDAKLSCKRQLIMDAEREKREKCKGREVIEVFEPLE